jgi:pimeloyl-ACP methyl ester carboxylesterase
VIKVLLALMAALALVLALGALATWLIARNVEARFPPTGRFVEVRGGRLHVLEAGPAGGAPAVVLLHGASSNAADLMQALGGRLAQTHRVIALDRPGHGWSERLGEPEMAQPAPQAAAVAEALRALGVERAVIVAHSWAGAVAPHLALDHRDVAGALVLLSPVTHPWPGGTISWYYGPATSVVGRLFTRTLTTPAGALLMGTVTRAVFAPQAAPEGYLEAARIPLVLRPSAFEANAQDVAGLYDAVTAQNSRYREIRVPATVIAGDVDRIVYTDIHSRSFAREVPGTKLIILPGIGHMPHYAATDLVVDEIEALAARLAQSLETRAAAP